MKQAVQDGFSASLNQLLERAKNSRWLAVFAGIIAAMFMQSATATALLTIGFLSTGALGIASAVAVVLGADLGSALAARILFLDFSWLPSLLLIIGTVLYLSSSSWRAKCAGRSLVGLGIMLVALQLMKVSLGTVSDNGIPADWMSVISSAPFIALVIAVFATWFAHSSVAIVLMTATLAATGGLPESIYLPLLLGANIGAGLIALPMVSGKNIQGRAVVITNIICRTAVAVLLFFTVPIWQPYLPLLSMQAGLQIIYLHMIINLFIVILFTPAALIISTPIYNWLRTRAESQSDLLKRPVGDGLSRAYLDKPENALDAARREATRLADQTEVMFQQALDMFDASDQSKISQLVKADQEINRRNKAIRQYLSEARNSLKSSVQESELDDILDFASTMEDIGDSVCYDLARQAKKRMTKGASFSEEGEREIDAIHKKVLQLLELTISSFVSVRKIDGKKLLKKTKHIRDLCDQSMQNHNRRFSNNQMTSQGSSSIHQDTVRELMKVSWILDQRLSKKAEAN